MTMEILVESAVRATVVALGVAGVLGVLRIRSPRLAHGTWVGVVVTMLFLPAFVAWGPTVELPLLPRPAVATTHLPHAGGVGTPQGMDGAADTPVPASPRPLVTGPGIAIAMHGLGVGVLLIRLVTGWRRARSIRREAIQSQGHWTHPACITPVTIGLVSPVVILPPDWATWDGAVLRAVLAHENEHARRHDPLVAALALLNRAVFWFHPLAWWLHREIARLSEQACDAAVVSSGHDTDAYLAGLLQFAGRVARAGGRIVPTASAMSGSGLPDRLRRLKEPRQVPPSRSRIACGTVACAAIVAICAVAAPTAAPAQDAPGSTGRQAAWSVDTSEHFVFVHDRLAAERVSDVSREAEEAYARLGAALRHDLPWPVTIILVRRDGEVSSTTAPALDVVRQSGGPSHRTIISLESFDRRAGIITHELTHFFAFDILPDVSRARPSLIEGLAEHQRGAWSPEELRLTRAAVAAGAQPSLFDPVAEERQWAHALFDYVAERRGDAGVRQLLTALRTQATLVRALPVAFSVPLEQFEEEFREYMTAAFGQR